MMNRDSHDGFCHHAWFVLAVGILECIEAIQESGFLPQLLSLY